MYIKQLSSPDEEICCFIVWSQQRTETHTDTHRHTQTWVCVNVWLCMDGYVWCMHVCKSVCVCMCVSCVRVQAFVHSHDKAHRRDTVSMKRLSVELHAGVVFDFAYGGPGWEPGSVDPPGWGFRSYWCWQTPSTAQWLGPGQYTSSMLIHDIECFH